MGQSIAEVDSTAMYEVLQLRKQVQDLTSANTKVRADLMSSSAEVHKYKTQVSTLEANLSSAELAVQQKANTIELLEKEISSLRSHKKLKPAESGTSASFLHSLVDGGATSALKTLKRENAELRAEVLN